MPIGVYVSGLQLLLSNGTYVSRFFVRCTIPHLVILHRCSRGRLRRIGSRYWLKQDEAFMAVAKGIREVVYVVYLF